MLTYMSYRYSCHLGSNSCVICCLNLACQCVAFAWAPCFAMHLHMAFQVVHFRSLNSGSPAGFLWRILYNRSNALWPLTYPSPDKSAFFIPFHLLKSILWHVPDSEKPGVKDYLEINQAYAADLSSSLSCN